MRYAEPLLRARRDNPELDYTLFKRGGYETVLSQAAAALWAENYGDDLNSIARIHTQVKDEESAQPVSPQRVPQYVPPEVREWLESLAPAR